MHRALHHIIILSDIKSSLLGGTPIDSRRGGDTLGSAKGQRLDD